MWHKKGIVKWTTIIIDEIIVVIIRSEITVSLKIAIITVILIIIKISSATLVVIIIAAYISCIAI